MSVMVSDYYMLHEERAAETATETDGESWGRLDFCLLGALGGIIGGLCAGGAGLCLLLVIRLTGDSVAWHHLAGNVLTLAMIPLLFLGAACLDAGETSPR